ncbi:MAG: hypothetical protein M1368_04415 [Thaumarchaeota archaeon]|nr:hypothetical protein [Nitrososphaerota archaeon]
MAKPQAKMSGNTSGNNESDSHDGQMSRRRAIGTIASLGIGVIAGVAVGGAGVYALRSAGKPSTTTMTQTVTKTATQTSSTFPAVTVNWLDYWTETTGAPVLDVLAKQNITVLENESLEETENLKNQLLSEAIYARKLAKNQALEKPQMV